MEDFKYINFLIAKDIKFALNSEKLTFEDLSKKTLISRSALNDIIFSSLASNENLEKFYSYLYRKGYRLNKIKGEVLKEIYKDKLILFHGSKEGLNDIAIEKGRENCDFGKGFYLSESYSSAAEFISTYPHSSIYSFSFDMSSLNVVIYDVSLEWMIMVCYFRNKLDEFKDNPLIKKELEKIEKADIIIAPIANNKMFFIMNRLVKEDISVEVALHSLSASSLGKQYVIKTNKALERLKVEERFYISSLEKNEYENILYKRADEIETKLKYVRREFKEETYLGDYLK